MSGLSLEQVTKTYEDGFTAVRAISLEIDPGSFVVLVGPSGCGKSTTLRMIAGLETITSGTMKIGDRVVNDLRPKDRDIAMVFQNYALYPHLSVAENMGFSLRMSGVSKPDRNKRVAHAAEMLGLASILNKKPGQLSGGQRQRVALGRAIVREPQVFLFDEPLSNLDPDRRVTTRAEIRRIVRELGTTTVYVTHDHEEAMAIGDVVVVMNEGIIEQAGSPSEVYENPVSKFVGRFLGSPKMNLIECDIQRSEARATLVSKEHSGLSLSIDSSKIHGISTDVASLGVRPQHIVMGSAQTNTVLIGTGTIQHIEQLGFARDFNVKLGPIELLVRENQGPSRSIGEQVPLFIDPDRLHVFA